MGYSPREYREFGRNTHMTTTYDCSHMSNHIWLITYDHFCWYMIAHIWPHVYDHICDTHMIAIFCSHMSARIWSYASMSNVCWYMMLVYECSHMIAHIWSYACTHMWCWYMSSHMNIPLSHIRFPIEMFLSRFLDHLCWQLGSATIQRNDDKSLTTWNWRFKKKSKICLTDLFKRCQWVLQTTFEVIIM